MSASDILGDQSVFYLESVFRLCLHHSSVLSFNSQPSCGECRESSSDHKYLINPQRTWSIYICASLSTSNLQLCLTSALLMSTEPRRSNMSQTVGSFHTRSIQFQHFITVRMTTDSVQFTSDGFSQSTSDSVNNVSIYHIQLKPRNELHVCCL